MQTTLVVMNTALRLDDNPALGAAMHRGGPVVPVFILDDEGDGLWKLGGARRWWVLQSLKALSAAIEARGNKLILRLGDYVDTLKNLIEETGADAVHIMRGYAPHEIKAQGELNKVCEDLGVVCKRFAGNLLIEPEQVRSKTGTPYRVFTPFWKQVREAVHVPPLEDAPDKIPAPERFPETVPFSELALDPVPAYWAKPIAKAWQPGEEGAHTRLADFLDDSAAGYKAGRDFPGEENTSRLSPYLANGEISARRIWQQTRDAIAANPDMGREGEAFLRELVWREFSWHLLVQFPELPERPLRPEFAEFPWQEGQDETVAAWQKGQTGFPIIDAGMRQLWQTGWMHNRVRMIVASFLVKDLLWHWRAGEDWFWDTLVDADLANNAASWQWVAGCGADAAPYFRIFNPILQGEKFDKAGDYVRRFVPELAGLPNKYIHQPFEAPEDVLKAAGVTLGETYPRPIVDRSAARKRALGALESIKK